MIRDDSEEFEGADSRADAVLHPTRLRIMNALSPNLQLSVPQISTILSDLPPSSLYRHMKTLVEAEAVRIIENTTARGTTEKLYALPEQEVILEREDLANARPEDLVRYFTNYVGTLLSHGRAFWGHTDPTKRRGGSYSADALYLTDEEYEHLETTLHSLTALLKSNQPGPGRRRRMFFTSVLPEVE